MANVLRIAWDGLSEVFFPACVWGGRVHPSGAAGKFHKSSGFRLNLEVLEPRMALAANPLVEPLVPAQPLVLGDAPYADQELRTDAVLGSSVVNVLQQAQPDYRVEAINTAGLKVAIYGRAAEADAWDVFAQRYDALGQAVGDALAVNRLTRGQQGGWSVAIDETGDFAVAWTGRSQIGGVSGPEVYVRRFDPYGLSLTEESQASQTELEEINRPDVAMGGDIFAVAWSGLTREGTGGVYARRFDSAGSALGSGIQVTSDPTAARQSPAIAVAADRQFVVAWVGATTDGSQTIFLQAFDADGLASGTAVQVAASSRGTPGLRDLVVDSSGNVTVFWTASGLSEAQSTQVSGLMLSHNSADDSRMAIPQVAGWIGDAPTHTSLPAPDVAVPNTGDTTAERAAPQGEMSHEATIREGMLVGPGLATSVRASSDRSPATMVPWRQTATSPRHEPASAGEAQADERAATPMSATNGSAGDSSQRQANKVNLREFPATATAVEAPVAEPRPLSTPPLIKRESRDLPSKHRGKPNSVAR